MQTFKNGKYIKLPKTEETVKATAEEAVAEAIAVAA